MREVTGDGGEKRLGMIRNLTRSTALAADVERCGTVLSRGRGLMLRARLREGEALLFPFTRPQRPWIHMLFVFFPVDMVFLSAEGVVCHLVRAKPFQLRIVPPVEVSALIELPAGTIAKSRTALGDRIALS